MEADCVFKLFVNGFFPEFFSNLFGVKTEIVFKNNIAQRILPGSYICRNIKLLLLDESIKNQLHPLSAATGTIGLPEELAHAIVFAIENTFMTGAEVVVDGGWTVQ